MTLPGSPAVLSTYNSGRSHISLRPDMLCVPRESVSCLFSTILIAFRYSFPARTYASTSGICGSCGECDVTMVPPHIGHPSQNHSCLHPRNEHILLCNTNRLLLPVSYWYLQGLHQYSPYAIPLQLPIPRLPT